MLFLLRCMSPVVAHSVALNPSCWGLLIGVKRTAMRWPIWGGLAHRTGESRSIMRRRNGLIAWSVMGMLLS
jgi:hypothetical protein